MRGSKPKWISAKTPPDNRRLVWVTIRDRVTRQLRVDQSTYVELDGEKHWLWIYGDVLAWMDLLPCTDPEIIGEVK